MQLNRRALPMGYSLLWKPELGGSIIPCSSANPGQLFSKIRIIKQYNIKIHGNYYSVTVPLYTTCKFDLIIALDPKEYVGAQRLMLPCIKLSPPTTSKKSEVRKCWHSKG